MKIILDPNEPSKTMSLLPIHISKSSIIPFNEAFFKEVKVVLDRRTILRPGVLDYPSKTIVKDQHWLKPKYGFSA